MAASVDYGPIYQAAGQEWNVDPSLIAAVAGQEGGGVSNVSPAGAQGHMQIMPDTQRDLGVTDPNNVVQSIYGGAKYLSQLIDHYQGQPDPVSAAVGAYNAGPGRMDDYIAGKGSLPAETVAYIPEVARRYQAITGSSGQSQPAPAIPGTDDAATSALDTRMAQLRAGGGQPASMPTAPPPAANTNSASQGGLVDYFSQAKAAALAATGGNGSPTAPTAPPPASTPSQPLPDGQTGAAAPGAPVDYFSMAKAAAQAATATPAAPGGAATPVSMPGTAQPSPTTAQAPSAPQAQTGYTVPYLGIQLPSATNLAEGAGHAALQASHGLYSVLNRVEQMAPGLNGLDRAVGINPSAALANLDAENQQYQNSGVGDTAAGTAGNMVGQTALTLPVLGPLGTAASAVGRGVAAGADAVSPALGSVARGAGNLLMGTASAPTNAVANAIVRPTSLAVNGALQGATAGVLTGDPNNTVGQNLLLGAGAGAIAGPAAAVAGRVVGGVTSAMTGLGGQVDPEIAALARTARDTYGIPITAPQLSENSLVRIANDQSAKLPFSGAGAVTETQQTAFNRAVANTFGETADRVTPDVMDRAVTRIGDVFNNIANRTNIQADPQLLGDLARIGTSARNVLPTAEQIPINRQIMNVLDAAVTGQGQISGNAYQAITGSGADLAQTMRAPDARVGNYASQVRDALDAAFQRSAAPGDQAALSEARGQYRAMKTVEDLVEKSPAGNISPPSLMGQVRAASSRFDSSNGGMAYTGGGPLGDLARIGQQFFRAQPNSGTPDRMLVNSILGGGAASHLGAVAVGAANPASLVAVPAGLAANRMAGSYLRGNFYTNNLLNSTLGTQNPIVNALMGVGPQAQALAPAVAATGASPLNRLLQ